MITAIDTNILVDLFRADRTFGPASKSLVRSCLTEGRLVACEIVWSEVACLFPSPESAIEAMNRLGVEFSAMELDAALKASLAWKEYKRRGGSRDRLVADFFIGAHAMTQSDRLLTRDRGFYRTYFSRLRILDPSKS